MLQKWLIWQQTVNKRVIICLGGVDLGMGGEWRNVSHINQSAMAGLQCV